MTRLNSDTAGALDLDELARLGREPIDDNGRAPSADLTGFFQSPELQRRAAELGLAATPALETTQFAPEDRERLAIERAREDQLFQEAREAEIATGETTQAPQRRLNQIRRELNLPSIDELPQELIADTSDRAINAVKQALKGFAETANRAVEGVVDLVDAITELVGIDFEPPSEFFEASRNVIRAYLPDDPRLRQEFLSSRLPAGLGSSAAFFASAPLGPVGLVATGVSLGAQEQAEQAREAGVEGRTKALATALGAALGLTETALPLRLLKVLKPVNRAVNGKLFSAILNRGGFPADVAIEATQELGQQLGGNIIAKVVLKQDQDLTEGLLDSAEVGGGVGAVFGGLARLAGIRLRKFKSPEAQAGAERGAKSAEAEPTPEATPVSRETEGAKEAVIPEPSAEQKAEIETQVAERAKVLRRGGLNAEAALARAETEIRPHDTRAHIPTPAAPAPDAQSGRAIPPSPTPGTVRKGRLALQTQAQGLGIEPFQESSKLTEQVRRALERSRVDPPGVSEAEVEVMGMPGAPVEPILEAQSLEQLALISSEMGIPIEGKSRGEILQQIKDHRHQAIEPPSPLPIPKSSLETIGFVPLQSLLEATKTGTRLVRAFAGRFLRSRGNLPAKVFKAKIVRDGWLERQLRQMRFLVGDLDSGIVRAFGKKKDVTAEQYDLMDRALKGQVSPEELPEPVRSPIEEMRRHIDAFSRHLVDEGLVSGPLAAVIEKNIGVYATRSYEVFTNPKWVDKVSQDVLNKAEALLRAEFPELAEPELKGMLDRLLYIGENSGSVIDVLNQSTLGAKDLSILTKRKDIPPEIRALWGEFRQPQANYAISIQKMASLIANARFLNTVREEGLGTFLFENPRTDERGRFIVRIAPKGSRALDPLDGLYTTSDIEAAMRRATEPQQLPDWLRHYMKINATVKFSKTVLSLMTHVRNTVGNLGFAVLNGHWRVWKVKEAVNATLASITGNDKAWRDYYLRLVELGVVSDNARQGELRAVLDDAMKSDVETFMDNSAKRKLKRVGRAATEAYRVEDDVWKVYGFENEKARYRKARPQWSLEQLERHAARIVRNGYPTYSMIPEAVRQVRRFPLVGTFVSFPAEVFRVVGHTMALIRTELSDPATRSIGVERLAGAMIAATGTAALGAAMRAISGVSRDDDEDMRRFLPPWSRNSELLHLGPTKQGNNRYIDLSYTDPFSYLKKPITAFMRGDDILDSAVAAFAEAAEPFLGEEILAERVFDVIRNRKKNGGPVYSPQAGFDAIAQDLAIHLLEPLEPGTVTSARRIARGLTGFVSPYGRSYDPKVEALAVFTGTRISEPDIPQSLKFIGSQAQSDLSSARSVFTRTALRRGAVGPEEIVRSLAASERSSRRLMSDLHKTVAAAQRLGVQRDEILAILKESGLGREDSYQAITGEFLPNGAISNMLYRITSPSALEDEKIQGARALQAIGADMDTLRPLLLREARWRSGKMDRTGKPLPRITDATRGRMRRLRLILTLAR